MRVYDDICDMLTDELEQIAQKRELTSNSLDIMDKAIDIVKDIKTIKAMDESGYSEHYPYYMYDDGVSYARGRRDVRRDSMGRYSRDEQGSKEHLVNQLDSMMRNASSEQEKDMIRKWMEQANR